MCVCLIDCLFVCFGAEAEDEIRWLQSHPEVGCFLKKPVKRLFQEVVDGIRRERCSDGGPAERLPVSKAASEVLESALEAKGLQLFCSLQVLAAHRHSETVSSREMRALSLLNAANTPGSVARSAAHRGPRREAGLV